MRAALAWYPRDVWLWAMASQWHLLGNAEPLIGRTAEAGDERGGRLVAARVARLLVELCFLHERRWRPYDKWLGSAFAQLDAAATAGPLVDALLDARDAAARERALLAALRDAALWHNALGLTEPLAPAPRPFEVGVAAATRPYPVLGCGRFVTACREAISDERLRRVEPVGAIDQLTHADDVVVNFTPWPQRLAADYAALLDG